MQLDGRLAIDRVVYDNVELDQLSPMGQGRQFTGSVAAALAALVRAHTRLRLMLPTTAPASRSMAPPKFVLAVPAAGEWEEQRPLPKWVPRGHNAFAARPASPARRS